MQSGDYFRTTIASATQSDAYRVIDDLLTSTTTRSLPSHDSEQELADRFVHFFHCKVTAIRTALDDMQQQLPPLVTGDRRNLVDQAKRSWKTEGITT